MHGNLLEINHAIFNMLFPKADFFPRKSWLLLRINLPGVVSLQVPPGREWPTDFGPRGRGVSQSGE